LKKYFMAVIMIVMSLLIVINHTAVQASVKNTVFACLNSILPSVFPFLIISSLIVLSGSAAIIGKPFYPLFRFIFGTSKCSSTAIILGLTAGFPIGASFCHELYKKGEITKGEAEYLLSFCSNSGISFIFGFLGGAVFGSIKAGISIFLIQMISSLLVGIILKNKKAKFTEFSFQDSANQPIIPIIVKSVKSSVINMAYICGYIVFFAVLTEVVMFFLPGSLSFIVKGICEITSASSELTGAFDRYSLVAANGLLSWGGLSVHMQVRAVTGELSMRPYFTGKLIHMAISMLTAMIVPIDTAVRVYHESVSYTYDTKNCGILFLLTIFIIIYCIFQNNSEK